MNNSKKNRIQRTKDFYDVKPQWGKENEKAEDLKKYSEKKKESWSCNGWQAKMNLRQHCLLKMGQKTLRQNFWRK